MVLHRGSPELVIVVLRRLRRLCSEGDRGHPPGSARTTRTKGAEAASGKGPASGAARCGSVRLGSGGSTAPPGGVLSVSNVFFL